MTMNITHDLHVHTYLSACCRDKEGMTVTNVLAAAEASGLRTVGFSDHLWMNAAVPPSSWYRPQDATQIRRLRNDLYAHLQELPFAYHAKAATGDLVQRCTSDVDMVRRFMSDPAVRATEVLLQERVPDVSPIIQPHRREAASTSAMASLPMSVTARSNAATVTPCRASASMRCFTIAAVLPCMLI